MGRLCARLLATLVLAAPALVVQSVPAAAVGPLDGRLVDHAADAGISEVARTWSTDVADYNGDGLDDFIYIRHNPQMAVQGLPLPAPTLYKATLSGRFVDSGIKWASKDRHKCSWADIDLDTDLDIFCAVGLTTSSENELRLQEGVGSGTFSKDLAPAFGLTRNTFGRYRTASFVNANFDLYPDIYVTRYYGSNNSKDDPSDPDPYPNELWINRNGNSFVRNASFKMDLHVGAPKTVRNCNQPIDYNDDGWQDLLVCGLQKLHIFRNNGGSSFTNVAGQLNASRFAKDADYADFDSDNHGDLVTVNATSVQVKLWTGNGFGNPVFSKKFDGPSGQDVAVGDFNGDGFRDIYVVRKCPKTHIFTDDPDLLLLGDGRGGFTQKTIPAVPRKKGCGDVATPIDWDHVGAEDLIVLNGHKLRSGPNQLFTWKAALP